jgi:choline transport protein
LSTVIFIHLSGYAAVLLALLICATPKHDAAYVFTVIINVPGWENNGIAWYIRMLSSLNGFIAIEAAAHYAEEMKNAARDLPKASKLRA